MLIDNLIFQPYSEGGNKSKYEVVGNHTMPIGPHAFMETLGEKIVWLPEKTNEEDTDNLS